MVVVGLAFLVNWLLVAVFKIELENAMLATALLFIIVGFLMGERPWANTRP